MSPRQHNKRRFARLPLNRPATLDGPRGSVDGTVRNISLNGVFLDAPGAWAGSPADRYTLSVALSPVSTVRMDLSLVHRAGSRAGFRCEHLDRDSLGHLKRLLALYYGAPAAVEKELAQFERMHQTNH
ncbi:MAG: PilZ domain-containing protein [Ectothiorhodospiraceae bacterium]|jgi:hypothetical protein